MNRQPKRTAVRIVVAGVGLAAVLFVMAIALAEPLKDCRGTWLERSWDSHGQQVPTHSSVCTRTNGEIVSWTCDDRAIIVRDGWPTCPYTL